MRNKIPEDICFYLQEFIDAANIIQNVAIPRLKFMKVADISKRNFRIKDDVIKYEEFVKDLILSSSMIFTLKYLKAKRKNKFTIKYPYLAYHTILYYEMFFPEQCSRPNSIDLRGYPIPSGERLKIAQEKVIQLLLGISDWKCNYSGELINKNYFAIFRIPGKELYADIRTKYPPVI